MIYGDTSALAKLLIDEKESTALRSWLGQRRGEPLVTSVVGEVELRRLAMRVGAGEAVGPLLNALDRLPLSAQTVAVAGRVGPPTLRSLDALHLAAATLVPDLSTLLSYDQRMVDAARELGLPVESPA